MSRALIYGVLGSLFFAFTFILNRSMNLSGGYWMWSASLRYIFTLPMMWIIVKKQRGTERVIRSIQGNLRSWLLWSTVGFGLFYLPLTMASVFGESWFVASTWQITIVMGILMAPFFHKRIPFINLIFSFFILLGVGMLQFSHIEEMSWSGNMKALLLILIAAISYPLGNRKMMEICSSEIHTTERIFGMTLCSMPFWVLVSVIALFRHGFPGGSQLLQSFSVALFSGVIATILFFEATNLVKYNQKQLAVVEATQAGEVVFTLLGGVMFLGDSLPSMLGFMGIFIIIAGMIGNSLASAIEK